MSDHESLPSSPRDESEDLFGPEAPLATPEQLKSWIIQEDADLLVFNKPGWLVCHPSKNGPWSSLVGAAREHTGLATLHLISRLDRETSGLILVAKNARLASLLQTALERREVDKTYHAVLCGVLEKRTEISLALEPDPESPVIIQQRGTRLGGGRKAQTSFIPVANAGGYSWVRVVPHTGRKHQIRAHAKWMGYPVAGDKVYGPDPTLYLEFIEHGWTPRLEAALPLKRQALHCSKMVFHTKAGEFTFEAPLTEDLVEFRRRIGLG